MSLLNLEVLKPDHTLRDVVHIANIAILPMFQEVVNFVYMKSNMLAIFINSICVMFSGQVFQRIVVIPIGTTCTPIFAYIRTRQTSY
jgi:hypothetical protein